MTEEKNQYFARFGAIEPSKDEFCVIIYPPYEIIKSEEPVQNSLYQTDVLYQQEHKRNKTNKFAYSRNNSVISFIKESDKESVTIITHQYNPLMLQRMVRIQDSVKGRKNIVDNMNTLINRIFTSSWDAETLVQAAEKQKNYLEQYKYENQEIGTSLSNPKLEIFKPEILSLLF